ncbi:SU10 major capsid protein [Bacillus safensis]|uniref:SU10 major capsid protein n=1 Tax=Bacillus safensis TaxID=561879 RepID=UPI002FFD6C82
MSQIFSNDLIGKTESVQDELLLLNPHQTPLLAMLGFSNPVTQTEHQWFEDEMFAYEGNVTDAAAADATVLKVSSVEPFRNGHVIKLGEELALVTAVNKSAKELTVVRGYANTTAAAITANEKVEVQFVEGSEGADARQGRYKPRKRVSNITQIFDETVEISGTAAAVANYGIADMYEYEKQKKQLELALQMEKAFVGGIRYENGLVRQLDGIRSFIKTNVTDLGGQELSLESINDSIQSIYSKGGFKSGGQYEIVVPAKQKRIVSKFDKTLVRINHGEESRGTVVNFITTDFGEFPVSINDNLAADEVLIVDKNRIKIRPLQKRDMAHKFLGEQGDYIQGMIVGEYTLEFQQEPAHARIKGAKN